jgi:hypothetical protein
MNQVDDPNARRADRRLAATKPRQSTQLTGVLERIREGTDCLYWQSRSSGGNTAKGTRP